MPTTSITFNNEFLTSTLMARLRDVKGMLDRPAKFVDDLESLGSVDEEGGERMLIPFSFNRHSRTTQLSTGYEPIDLSVNPILTPGYEGWFDAIRPIVISGHEQRINRGKYAVVQILDARTKDVMNGLRLEFQQALLQGGVAAMSDLVPINGVDVSNGFFEAVAYGSQTNVVHNTSKATYATAVGWQNQSGDLANSFSSNGLIKAYDMQTRIMSISESQKHRWYASINATNFLKRALQSNERYLSERDLDGGKRVMVFGDVPIVTVQDLPNAGTGTTAKPFSMMLVDWNEIKFVRQSGFYMKPAPFEGQPGYNTKAAYVQLMGQLRATYLATSGLLYSGEVW